MRTASAISFAFVVLVAKPVYADVERDLQRVARAADATDVYSARVASENDTPTQTHQPTRVGEPIPSTTRGGVGLVIDASIAKNLLGAITGGS
jgi:hypothetical protein